MTRTKTAVDGFWLGHLSRDNVRTLDHHDAELQRIRFDIHGEDEFVSAMKMNILEDIVIA
jgi:hypothetical protein